jgi:hypothetical protein
MVGALGGTMMFIVKLGGSYLLLGGNNGWNVPLLGNVNMWKWMHKSYFRRGMFDLVLAYTVAHLFAGSILGMICAMTFAAWSMLYLFSDIMWNKACDVGKEVYAKAKINW